MRTVTKMPELADYTMKISADSKEELEETIKDHAPQGWRETTRTIARDGTYHANLRKKP